MRKYLILNLMVLGACGGANPVDVDSQAENGQPLNAAAVAYVHGQAARLGLGRGDGIRQRQDFMDELGQQHTRFERTHHGLPVRGGDFVVHQGAGITEDLTSIMESPIAIESTPELASQRLSLSVMSSSLPTLRDAKMVRQPELVIYAYDGPENLTLAYEIVTKGTAKDGTPSVLHSFVDANKGELIASYDEIETASGTGYGLYSGTVALTISSSGSDYQLYDSLRGRAETTDPSGTVISSPDNSFGDGGSDDPTSAAVDAHYGAQVTWDYYKTVHGRDGIADDGQGATSVVHYGTDYNNAFWSDDCFCMTYGDGDGNLLMPLVALDVAGHEMSHGVTSQTAALVYLGESGGLNEATSDIFGSAVEFFAKNRSQPGNYLIGEHVVGPGLSRPFLRSMKSPTDDGVSIDHYSKYRRGMDVHLSSGIANNFFYLLAEGGRNKTSGKSVTGIGRAKAEKIWYRALTVYFTSNTSFKSARAATLSATRDLFSSGGAEERAVSAAWSAVGVN